MKQAIRVVLIGLWVLLVTITLMILLIRSNIDARLPDSFVSWLFDEFDLLGVESYQDLMAGIFFVFSFIVASLLTWAGWFLWRHIKAR